VHALRLNDLKIEKLIESYMYVYTYMYIHRIGDRNKCFKCTHVVSEGILHNDIILIINRRIEKFQDQIFF